MVIENRSVVLKLAIEATGTQPTEGPETALGNSVPSSKNTRRRISASTPWNPESVSTGEVSLMCVMLADRSATQSGYMAETTPRYTPVRLPAPWKCAGLTATSVWSETSTDRSSSENTA